MTIRLALKRITCRRCGNRDEFTVIRAVKEVLDLHDEDGVLAPEGDWEFANEIGRTVTISCRQCGHAWVSRRRIEQ
jgi:ribosomal protein L37E